MRCRCSTTLTLTLTHTLTLTLALAFTRTHTLTLIATYAAQVCTGCSGIGGSRLVLSAVPVARGTHG